MYSGIREICIYGRNVNFQKHHALGERASSQSFFLETYIQNLQNMAVRKEFLREIDVFLALQTKNLLSGVFYASKLATRCDFML